MKDIKKQNVVKGENIMIRNTIKTETKEIIERDVEKLFTNMDSDYISLETVLIQRGSGSFEKLDFKELCEAIIYTADTTNCEAIELIDNVDIATEIGERFNCEVKTRAVLNYNDNFYLVARAISNDTDSTNYYMKKLDKYDSDRYLTVETVIEGRSREILEIKCLMAVSIVKLASIVEEISFEDAIELTEKGDFFRTMFKAVTTRDMLDSIPNLTSNSLAYVCNTKSREDYDMVYNKNINDITWTAMLTSLTLVTDVLNRVEDIVEAIKEAYRITMQNSTIRYM